MDRLATLFDGGRQFLPRKHPHAVRQGVEANYQTFVQNLRDATEHINENHDVAGLCASFLARIDKMVEGKGERLQS